MNDVEEDIEKCEEFINLSFLYGKLCFTSTQLYEYQKAIEKLISRVRDLEGKPKEIKVGYDCDEDQEIIDALCIIQNKCIMDCGSIGCNNCRFGESNGDCLLAHRPRSWKINNTREFKFLK